MFRDKSERGAAFFVFVTQEPTALRLLTAEAGGERRDALGWGRGLLLGDLLEAEAGDDAALGVDLADPLDEAPFVLVLLEHAEGLAGADHELVGERGHEGACDDHQPGQGLAEARAAL